MMMSSARRSIWHGTRALEIIQTCSLIMTHLRKELRIAPEVPVILNNKLIIKIPKKGEGMKQRFYFYNPQIRQLYSGERDPPSDAEPMPGDELKPYKFDNGQIVDFRFDSSDRGEESWIINEMSMNNKYWFKVEMDVIFSKDWKKMSDEAKQKVLSNAKLRRRFSITITPRHKNWMLQNTQ
ncbi:hypothetical protein ACFL35_01820 [Candidatus Riflebacteria bacterium]